MADEFEFPVSYSGAGVEPGRIDVRDLAPSLIGLGSSCQRIAEYLYGPDTTLRVEIKASGRPGSFITDLVLVCGAVAGTGALWCPPGSARAIFEKLKGTIGIIKEFGSRKEKPSVKEIKGGIVVLGDGNNITVNMNKDDFDLAMDKPLAGSIADLASPLQRHGVERIGLGSDNDPNGVISRADVPALTSDEPPIKTPGVEQKNDEREAVVRPVQIRLDGNERAWRVSEKDQQYSVHVGDKDFLDAVSSGAQVLMGGTALRVRLRTTWDLYPDNQERNIKRTVLKVLKVIPPKDTLSLLPPDGS